MSKLNQDQFEQLPMFVKPSDLHAANRSRPLRLADGYEMPAQEVRDWKLEEAHAAGWTRDDDYDAAPTPTGPSLNDQIREEGVKAPIEIGLRKKGSDVLANGHHRYFVAEQLEREDHETYIPVTHYVEDDGARTVSKLPILRPPKRDR